MRYLFTIRFKLVETIETTLKLLHCASQVSISATVTVHRDRRTAHRIPLWPPLLSELFIVPSVPLL
ncbi:hypothetical protein HanRHA438_Chr08g0331591 [Helianthus annuus]|nr:hypothetical protein HanHA89_Chr08g0281601 [Helianthus annuus]KAJ0896195.1 hypothetical protein HanRHA438_Chr08g0331591 [Helianthus annuus]